MYQAYELTKTFELFVFGNLKINNIVKREF